ncbi:hypothetical protein AKO1_009344 [Acrasis kona]|uniref:RWP-RK domain-containing protein n=1 Tax=Acrasis kona TaxID=1008807 RepID=A0AAW2ZMI3_9EUKA
MKFSLTKAEIQQQFHLPLEDAARSLGICASVLKKTCRHHGIKRLWPYRKIKSLNKKKISLEQSVKTFYNQYHKMKLQLDQVNKERKDMLLKETGWDSLEEEPALDHPAFHQLEGMNASLVTEDDSSDSYDDIGEDSDSESIIDKHRTNNVTITPITRSENHELFPQQQTPITTSENWINYTCPKQKLYKTEQTHVYNAPQQLQVYKEQPSTEDGFKIPSINDLLAGIKDHQYNSSNASRPPQYMANANMFK